MILSNKKTTEVNREKENPWHSLNLNEILTKLKTTPKGLNSFESLEREKVYGKNFLPRKRPPGIITVFFRQFKSPLIYFLGIAAIVSIYVKEYSDASFIGGVLLINALIGCFQEWKAEKGSHALQKLIKIHARVQRGDEIVEVEAESLVPGDLVWLEAGMGVPADLRLVTTNNLQIDESLLTGESESVLKQGEAVDFDSVLAEKKSIAFAGSIVSRGKGSGLVVATAGNTEVGKIAKNVDQLEVVNPPLIVRMENFVKVISITVFIFAVVLAIFSIMTKGADISQVFMFTVALAVSAIPEGLPIAMTVALAIATSKMAKRNVIVKKLAAVEGLGSCTMIATDKTGTLTCNELTAREVHDSKGRVFTISGEGYEPNGKIFLKDQEYDFEQDSLLNRMAVVGALCNEADLYLKEVDWTWYGDPVDIAFLSMAHKFGHTKQELLIKFPFLCEIPFEPERGYAATYHKTENRNLVFVKGAPEKVLAMSNLSQDELSEAFLKLESMAKRGLRVLALSEGIENRFLEKSSLPPIPENLTFLGFVGMIDPPRPGALRALQACYQSGIKVAMVTGDHKLTAIAIASELGIYKENSKVITGTELELIDEDQLMSQVSSVAIFARTTPMQKLRIVEAAKRVGEFVAVTGDGINDAPVLKAANVGVAMGKSGTDVAKEAADLIITDDKFSSIVAGIEEGRIAYDNIRKVIYLLISTGAGELVLVSLAIIFGMPMPLLPVQLLWLNLVTNGIQDVALALEPGEDGVILRPPRLSKEKIFNRLMIERTIVAALTMGLLGFISFTWFIKNGHTEFDARNLTLLLLVLFENVHVGNSRSETRSAFSLSPLKSPFLLIGTIGAFSIHLFAMNFKPLQSVLSIKSIEPRSFLQMFTVALVLLVVMELHKLSWKFRKRIT